MPPSSSVLGEWPRAGSRVARMLSTLAFLGCSSSSCGDLPSVNSLQTRPESPVVQRLPDVHPLRWAFDARNPKEVCMAVYSKRALLRPGSYTSVTLFIPWHIINYANTVFSEVEHGSCLTVRGNTDRKRKKIVYAIQNARKF